MCVIERRLPLRWVQRISWLLAVVPSVLAGCVSAQTTHAEWPAFKLRAIQTWPLSFADDRFDASGLLQLPSGEWLTVNDRESLVYRIQFQPGTNAPSLAPLTNCFTAAQFASFARGDALPRDTEGLAVDPQGRIYVCDEANRWILRCDPAAGTMERLAIDWTPVQNFFDHNDRNASFEGIAIGDGKLYVANERSSAVIIVVDLVTLKVVDYFVVRPKVPSLMGFLHYSDLAWFEGRLWVLCRHHRVVLEVDPVTKRTLAEFNYQQLEDALGYDKQLPTGMMEGLAVTADAIWILTDNNDRPRGRGRDRDLRPTLVRCNRPDKGVTPP